MEGSRKMSKTANIQKMRRMEKASEDVAGGSRSWKAGRLWKAVESSGRPWKAVEGAEGSRRRGRPLKPLKAAEGR